MVMVEPSFLALTTTPSIAPSSAEVTTPVSAVWAPAPPAPNINAMALHATSNVDGNRMGIYLHHPTPARKAASHRFLLTVSLNLPPGVLQGQLRPIGRQSPGIISGAQRSREPGIHNLKHGFRNAA